MFLYHPHVDPPISGFEVGLTIMAIPAHSTDPHRKCSPANIFHPDSLFCLPPIRMTRYVISVMPSRTTVKDMRKPTDRHMEQK